MTNPSATRGPIRLLATDFDGTLYRYGSQKTHYASFAELLVRLRSAGAIWVVCSGRPLASIGKATRRMSAEGVTPDVIITRNVWACVRRDGAWWPRVGLTWAIIRRDRRRRRALARTLRGIIAQLRGSDLSCRVTTLSPHHYRLQFRSTDEATGAVSTLAKLSTDPAIRTVQWQREVDVRSVPSTKAVAVLEVAQRHGIPPADTLAIGDGRSDLGMLHPSVAAMTGCPINATHDVIEAVMNAGGHIAGAQALDGTVEVIEAWLQGQVRSVPPAMWRPPRGELGLGANASSEEDQRRAGRMAEAALIAGSMLVAMVALDSASGIRVVGRLLRGVRWVLQAVWSTLAG